MLIGLGILETPGVEGDHLLLKIPLWLRRPCRGKTISEVVFRRDVGMPGTNRIPLIHLKNVV